MNVFTFIIALAVILVGGLIILVRMVLKQMNDASDVAAVKMSWGEWQELSTRAKETLINHGFKPPVAPHATFHRPAVYGGKTPRRPLGRTLDHDIPHTAPKGGGGVGDMRKYLQGPNDKN